MADLTDEGVEFIKRALEFGKYAFGQCKEIGPTYFFTCPLCGGRAWAGRSPGNGHLHAACESCGVNIHQ